MSDRPFLDPQSEAMHDMTQNILRADGLPTPRPSPRPEDEHLEWPSEWGGPPGCYYSPDGSVSCVLANESDFELLRVLKDLRVAWKAGDDATVKTCTLMIHELLIRRKVDGEYTQRWMDGKRREHEKKERERRLRDDPKYAAAFRAFTDAVNSGDPERIRTAQERLNGLG